MNNVLTSPPPPMTVDEYLAWATSLRETKPMCLVGGHVMIMSPQTAKHRAAKMRIARMLEREISQINGSWIVEPDGATVRVDRYTAYEPDALVYRGARLAPNSLEVPEPVIIVEVLSPSTRRMDLGGKLADYFTLPSVVHYLVIDPDAQSLIHFRRGPDGRADLGETHTAGSVRLDPPGIAIDVAELFAEA